ncbi:MAG: efflux RND transporter periplasmic adaptor subunit [Methylocystaceae bacterium]|nr:efflux RND transporter periplasmic adaptor subunit [Methylocystaceae bacterium]
MTLPENKSILIAVAIALVISLWLLSGIFTPQEEQVAKSVTEGQEHKEVHVLVERQNAHDHADIIRLYGQTKADRSVEIKAEIDGRIKDVLIEKGAHVKKGDVIARINIDERESTLKSAKALVYQRQLEYEASRKLSQKSFRSQTQLAEAEALLNAAHAELESARLNMEHTEIKAPFDGKLESRPVEIGDYVSKGTLLATVVDLSPIVVQVEVSENDISRIKDGQPATAILNNNQVIDGIVRFVASTSSSSTRTYVIEIEGNNLNDEIAAGQTAQVNLNVGMRQSHLVSPAILTLSDKGEIGVKTVDDENKVVFYPIKLLEDTSEGVWVSGLPESANIILRGQEYVSPGQKVIAMTKDQTQNPDLADAKGH